MADLIVEIGAQDNLSKGLKSALKSIQQLENELKDFDKALSVATDPSDIIRLNKAIASTQNEVKVLRNLGASSDFAAGGINKLGKATSNYNGVGIEFSRIIQDAPFGIIGVGNNITQLATSFQNLRGQSKSTGEALKTALSSIISPANLLVLGISAVTTALTLYQMGAFGSKKETEDLKDTLDKYRKSLSETNQALLDGAKSADSEIVKIGALKRIIEDETVSRDKRLIAINELKTQYPTIFENLDTEQLLAGKVAESYDKVTASLVARATAEDAVSKIVALRDEERIILDKNADAIARIAKEEEVLARFRAQGQTELVTIQENTIRFLKNQSPEVLRLTEIEGERKRLTDLINESLKESIGTTRDLGSATEDTKKDVKDLVNEYQVFLDTISALGSTDEQIIKRAQATAEQEDKPLIKDFGNLAGENAPIKELADELENEKENITNNLSEITNAFSQLGFQVAGSLNISNDALKGFVGTLISNTPKIIQALIQQAAAKKAQAASENQSNLSIATGNAIVAGSKAAAGMGPIGLALLPVLVGGAVALISSAFKKGGGGGGFATSGASGVGGGQASNFSGGSTAGNFDPNRNITLSGGFEISGDKLRYVLNQSEGFRN